MPMLNVGKELARKSYALTDSYSTLRLLLDHIPVSIPRRLTVRAVLVDNHPTPPTNVRTSLANTKWATRPNVANSSTAPMELASFKIVLRDWLSTNNLCNVIGQTRWLIVMLKNTSVSPALLPVTPCTTTKPSDSTGTLATARSTSTVLRGGPGYILVEETRRSMSLLASVMDWRM
uniref:Uncharacterized protein n=1 Tax=Cacopsylla melanoneura TaxID=428564 RepID=A0A8D9BIV9_9HEMI